MFQTKAIFPRPENSVFCQHDLFPLILFLVWVREFRSNFQSPQEKATKFCTAGCEGVISRLTWTYLERGGLVPWRAALLVPGRRTLDVPAIAARRRSNPLLVHPALQVVHPPQYSAQSVLRPVGTPPSQYSAQLVLRPVSTPSSVLQVLLTRCSLPPTVKLHTSASLCRARILCVFRGFSLSGTTSYSQPNACTSPPTDSNYLNQKNCCFVPIFKQTLLNACPF